MSEKIATTRKISQIEVCERNNTNVEKEKKINIKNVRGEKETHGRNEKKGKKLMEKGEFRSELGIVELISAENMIKW